MSHYPLALRASALLVLGIGGAACSSSSGPPADTRSLNGSAGDLVGGTGSMTGMYGSEAVTPVTPIMAAYWVGQPDDPTESAGGPFVNLFSTAVTCNDISVNGWLSKIPATTQVLELIIGTKTIGTASPAASAAAANVAEVNYLFARPSDEVRAGAGSVTVRGAIEYLDAGGGVTQRTTTSSSFAGYTRFLAEAARR